MRVAGPLEGVHSTVAFGMPAEAARIATVVAIQGLVQVSVGVVLTTVRTGVGGYRSDQGTDDYMYIHVYATKHTRNSSSVEPATGGE